MGIVEEIVSIGEIVGGCLKTIRRTILVSQDAQLAVAGQFDVGTHFYLCRRGVLQSLGALYVIDFGMRVVSRCGCHGEIANEVIDIFLVGIEVHQSGRLGVEADTTADVEPFCHGERSIQTGREGGGSHIAEGLH